MRPAIPSVPERMRHNQFMSPFLIDAESPLTTWGQVQLDLKRQIESGQFMARSKLPSESVLSEHYGVSRATVRRAIAHLIKAGLLHSRRGSGTFVSDDAIERRLDVNLLRPWREQLLATGHVARSRLIRHTETTRVPEELIRFVEYDNPAELGFGLHLQEVDGVPIAMTESWSSPTKDRKLHKAAAAASGTLRVAFALQAQAEHLRTAPSAVLLEVTTCSRLRETGELVELARTSWVANRVNLSYSRALTVGQIDMSELLTYVDEAPPPTATGSSR